MIRVQNEIRSGERDGSPVEPGFLFGAPIGLGERVYDCARTNVNRPDPRADARTGDLIRVRRLMAFVRPGTEIHSNTTCAFISNEQ